MKMIIKSGRTVPIWLEARLKKLGIEDFQAEEVNELVDDYLRLIEAIAYWRGRSAARVAEFNELVGEIEIEMIELDTTGKSRTSNQE
jgi:hypothetical protein